MKRATAIPIFLMLAGILLVIVSPIIPQPYGIECFIYGLAASFLGLAWMGLLSLNVNGYKAANA